MNFAPCKELVIRINVLLQDDEGLGGVSSLLTSYSLFAEDL